MRERLVIFGCLFSWSNHFSGSSLGVQGVVMSFSFWPQLTCQCIAGHNSATPAKATQCSSSEEQRASTQWCPQPQVSSFLRECHWPCSGLSLYQWPSGNFRSGGLLSNPCLSLSHSLKGDIFQTWLRRPGGGKGKRRAQRQHNFNLCHPGKDNIPLPTTKKVLSTFFWHFSCWPFQQNLVLTVSAGHISHRGHLIPHTLIPASISSLLWKATEVESLKLIYLQGKK